MLDNNKGQKKKKSNLEENIEFYLSQTEIYNLRDRPPENYEDCSIY